VLFVRRRDGDSDGAADLMGGGVAVMYLWEVGSVGIVHSGTCWERIGTCLSVDGARSLVGLSNVQVHKLTASGAMVMILLMVVAGCCWWGGDNCD